MLKIKYNDINQQAFISLLKNNLKKFSINTEYALRIINI